jgi:hypothetical protein
MFQLAGLQLFYMGCLGLGFAYLTGSLALSGIGARSGGRGGGMKGGARINARVAGARAGAHGARGGVPSAQAVARGGVTGKVPLTPSVRTSGVKLRTVKVPPAGKAPAARVQSQASKVQAPTKAQTPAKVQTSTKVQSQQGAKVKAVAPSDLTDAVSGSLESVSSSKSNSTPLFENVYLAFLSVFNPMFLSLFLFSFGAAGLVFERAFRITEDLGMGLACIAAIVIAFQLQNFMGWFSAKLECSTVESVQDALGSVGEVTVTIPEGKFGEITLVVGLTRSNYPAKAFDPAVSIKKRTQIFVVELEQGIAIVDVLEPES